jgi:hypothetical protein
MDDNKKDAYERARKQIAELTEDRDRWRSKAQRYLQMADGNQNDLLECRRQLHELEDSRLAAGIQQMTEQEKRATFEDYQQRGAQVYGTRWLAANMHAVKAVQSIGADPSLTDNKLLISVAIFGVLSGLSRGEPQPDP